MNEAPQQSYTVVLGSKSPARLATLRQAGIEPAVVYSYVDEDAIAAGLADDASPSEVVESLATAKAIDVADEVIGLLENPIKNDDSLTLPAAEKYLVVGADSMLHINGRLVGKPHTAEVAVERIREMRGSDAILWTGHALVKVERGPGGAWASGAPRVSSASTVVHFGEIHDDEIAAYVATGEPLEVAGSFTIDALGGPFVRGVTGDPHAVVGLSLPLLRDLVQQEDVFWPDLWNRR